MPAKKQNLKKTEGSDLADKRLSDPLSFLPPWPEWNDSIVNATNWDPTIHPPLKKGPGASKKSNISKVQQAETSVQPECFEEPGNHGILPRYMPEVKWIRPSTVNKEVTYVIQPEESPLRLLENNIHLLQYKIMRRILSSIMSLETAGKLNPFPVDYQNENYIANTDGEWEPWHHVYAMTKAGRGTAHNPKYNPYGLYYVRLFYMGHWRQIVVDDFLAYDASGKLLLPLTQNENNLWLPILVKALLRVASIAWLHEKNSDFNVITCLTGWICNKVTCWPAVESELWGVLWTSLVLKEENDVTNEAKYCGSASQTSCVNKEALVPSDRPMTKYIFAEIPECTEADSCEIYIPEISPNFEHVAYLKSIKEELTYVEPYSKWKIYRWIEWSVKSGQIKIEDYIPVLIQKIEVFSPFKYSHLRPWKFKKYLASMENEELANSIWMGYKCFRRNIRSLEVYYSQSHFKYSVSTYNIASYISSTLKAGQNKNLGNEREYFYISMECVPNYIICEHYNWKMQVFGTFSFSLRITGSDTYNLVLPPGLQVCRLWYHLPNEYHLQINSRTEFFLHSKDRIHEYLVNDSISYNMFADEMQKCFLEILETGQTDESIDLIAKYMRSFYPPYYQMKIGEGPTSDELLNFFKVFEECLIDLLLQKINKCEEIGNVLIELQNIFRNQHLGEDYLMEANIDVYNYVKQKQLDLKLEEKTERGSKGSKKGKSPKSKKKGEKVIAKSQPSLFLNFKENCIELLKTMMVKKDELLKFYPFRYDSDMKLCYYDFKGVTKVNANEWILLGRLIVNIHSIDPIACGILTFSNLNSVNLRVYDIETNQEIRCSFQPNGIYEMTRSKRGYVIVLYGYLLEDPSFHDKEVTWTIRVLGVDPSNLLHQCAKVGDDAYGCSMIPVQPSPLNTMNLPGSYFPNEHRVICKFLIKIVKEEIVTLKFSASNQNANISLCIKGNNEFTNVEGNGIGNIVIPAICLTPESAVVGTNNGDLYYTGEVCVQGDSWEITKEEMMFLINLRMVSKDTVQPLKRLSTSSKHSIFHGPHWTLSIMNDAQKSGILLMLDKREHEWFVKLQSELEEAEPGRLDRAIYIRNQFLGEEESPYFDDPSNFSAFDGISSNISSSLLHVNIEPRKTAMLLELHTLYSNETFPRGAFVETKADENMSTNEWRTPSTLSSFGTTPSASNQTFDILSKQVNIGFILDTKQERIKEDASNIIEKCFEEREIYINDQLAVLKAQEEKKKGSLKGKKKK